MNDIITGLIYPQLRKLIYGACMSWIAMIIEWAKANNIPIDQAVIDNWISILLALLGMAACAFYTWAKNKWTSKTAVTVPTVIVPTVQSAVQSLPK